ncbi:class A beta-lactamase [Pseudidiomarina sp.]|uniref:class A beta-lactamase n=1 Tax=Pseudidiomarina sp. TaxID=2081707 RepID=UPI003A98395E
MNDFLKTILLLTSTLLLLLSVNVAANELVKTVAALETKLQARIGFAAHNLNSDQRWEYKANERFATASTFKVLACAALLKKSELRKELITSKVIMNKEELVAYSPVLDKLDHGTPIAMLELCEATLVSSDNTAANYILKVLGGPQAVTEFARSLGDTVTRLDRWETELNEAKPGDLRDTTTPRAMLDNLTQLLLGDELAAENRSQLIDWMRRTQTASSLFRAVLPSDWVIADRTGAGGYGTRNFIAVIWPPEKEPLVVTVFITNTEASFAERNAAIREVGKAVVKQVSN